MHQGMHRNPTMDESYRAAQELRRRIEGHTVAPATVEGIYLANTTTGPVYRVHGYHADGSHWHATTFNGWRATCR